MGNIGSPMATAAMLALLAMPTANSAPLKPNIVFFLADDYGFADVSYHTEMYGRNANVVHTPNLDALAHQGVRLENYYVQPVCSPTRSCIMTGRYVIHTGVHTPFMDATQNALLIDEVTIAQRLKHAGYATHAVGKWHLGFKTWAHTPQERGFDTFFGYYGGSTDYYTMDTLCWPDAQCFTDDTPDHEALSGWDLHRDRVVLRNSTEYSTVLFTDEADRVIGNHAATAGQQGTPLFLYLPYQAVHVGNKQTQLHPEYGLYQVPHHYVKPYEGVVPQARKNLSAMVAAMDEAAGNVTASLKRHGLWDRSIFIFSTDNGGPLPTASNYPLRGGKASLWEGGIRGIGFVVAGDNTWLGFRTSGQVVNAMMHVSDWLPTLCDPELAGCDMANPPGKKLDGVSAWSAIARNGSSLRNTIVHDVRASDRQTALRVGRLKLLYGEGNGTRSSPLLFDVVGDVGETTDLSADPKYATVLAEMKRQVDFWINESMAVVDQATVPPDPRSNPALHGGSWLPWLPDNCSDFDCPPPPSPRPGPGPPGHGGTPAGAPSED